MMIIRLNVKVVNSHALIAQHLNFVQVVMEVTGMYPRFVFVMTGGTKIVVLFAKPVPVLVASV
jgi:hypothetical protein